MLAKLKKLKDNAGKYILPITHSDAVHVDSNGKTLTQKLNEIGTGGSGTPSTGQYQGKKVLFFGDSITEGTYGQKYGSYVGYAVDILGCTYENKGSSGSGTGRLWAIVEGHAAPDVAITYTRPNYATVSACTIMIGTNGGVGTSTLADITGYSDYNSYPSTFYGNLGKCIEFIQSQNSAIKIYLVTPPKNTRGHAQTIVNAMEEIGSYYGISVVDVDNNCGINPKNFTTFLSDGTHPNDAGHRRIGTYIGNQLNVL